MSPGREEGGPGCSETPEPGDRAAPGRGVCTDPHRRAASRAQATAPEGADRRLWVSAFPKAAPSAPSSPRRPGGPQALPRAGTAQGARARAPREARAVSRETAAGARPTSAGGPVGRRAGSPWRRPRERAPNARRRPRGPDLLRCWTRAGGREGSGALGENAEAGRPLPRPWGRDERPHPGDPSPLYPEASADRPRLRPLSFPGVKTVLAENLPAAHTEGCPQVLGAPCPGLQATSVPLEMLLPPPEPAAGPSQAEGVCVAGGDAV